MAKGKKTGGKDIQPGEVRNPNGRPKLPEYLKKARKMNKTLLDEYMNKYINCPITELHRIVTEEMKRVKGENKTESEVNAMEMMIIKVILEGTKKGDYKHIDFILDRTIGKVKDVVEVQGNMHDALMEIIRKEKEHGPI